MSRREGHAGNKAFLPSKLCEQCGRPMTWRKAWARNWDAVKYCSDRCRGQARRPSA
ncbi:DUF2256 domain-containing protein [Hydrogenophaga sp.]|uniref:DUF2256 domain-containing protein n=1 Tax=Hydrogenophaga sp. TaxID=1904254 RepID=UPI0035AF83E6